MAIKNKPFTYVVLYIIKQSNTCTYLASYSDNIGGSSSPWLVLEYLPNGDLKSFLMVYYYIALFCVWKAIAVIIIVF